MNSITLKERKQRTEEHEAKILQALTCRKKQFADTKRDKKQKKKSVDALLSLLSVKDIRAFRLRPAETYVPKSYNLDRQVIGLLNHLFVRYPVPYFLYQVCLVETEDPRRGSAGNFTYRQDVYRQWFITLAQGGSFPKAVKGLMTSKEACAFLDAPWDRKVHENVWWAKMKVVGVPDALIGKLIDRIFTNHFFDDPDGRLAEAVLFYARQHSSLSRNSFEEVTDFLAEKLRTDRQFRLKGRTASSVVRLSNEWHHQMQRARLGKHIQWPGLGIATWEHQTKDEAWEAIELRDNKELVNEGRKQKHCVYSYVDYCVSGRCAIFSLRAYRKIVADYDADGKPLWDKTCETRRITVEVSPLRSVVQVRGALNRAPTLDEKNILRLWAGEKGLRIHLGV